MHGWHHGWLYLDLAVLQIIDRLCASVHYRQAVSCEDNGTSMAASPSTDCLVRVTMSRSRVVHLPASGDPPAPPTGLQSLLQIAIAACTHAASLSVCSHTSSIEGCSFHTHDLQLPQAVLLTCCAIV